MLDLAFIMPLAEFFTGSSGGGGGGAGGSSSGGEEVRGVSLRAAVAREVLLGAEPHVAQVRTGVCVCASLCSASVALHSVPWAAPTEVLDCLEQGV